MRIVEGESARAEVRRLAARGAVDLARVEATVSEIVTSVRQEGEAALRGYSEHLDGLAGGQPLRVAPEEIAAALAAIPPELRAAMETAAANIRQYCQWQMPRPWMRRVAPGRRVGQLVRPLASVGCYVPGGRYPLPSTVLMTVIPAQVAGVKRIVVVSPRPAAATLAAAALLGVEEFYRIGGAQAVAALAYGTQTITRVDKIVGPGNLYVTAAKKMVAWDCAIDFLAGPTEVVLVSHEGNPTFLASDLVAQAEHDPDACAIFVTTSRELAEAVVLEADRLSLANDTARQSLKQNALVLVAASRDEAMEFANAIASEHLTVPAEDVARVEAAGAVFVGDYSPQAMGDYASGPNHVLPTAAVARYRGGLSVLDYVKIVSVQEASRAGLKGLAPTISLLADAEGLKAHGDSVRLRCEGARRRPRAAKAGRTADANAGAATGEEAEKRGDHA
jgi:histidinol dehydrogenase